MKNVTFEDFFKNLNSKKSNIPVMRSGNISYSYDRVSSRDQMVNGNSLVWQFERIDDFAGKANYTIKSRYGGTYESAKNDERKEFQRMINDVKKDKSVSTILVYSYDRFSRSGANGIYLLENLQKLGVKIVAVTQEVDSATPTGNFQQNLYMLLSKLDNDMRKDKSVSGTKSILRKGYWPYATPVGYTNQNKNATADRHVYVINEDGLLLKRAFQWKASGKITNQQIIEKLEAKGLKITIRYIAWIFANPFYCGYISTSLISGEIIKGKHPALVDEKTFFQVNSISRQNPRSGVKKTTDQNDLPLKIFMKDGQSNSPFTGYYNKKKNLYYYKSRDKGSKVSVSAKWLNTQFENILSGFHFESRLKEKISKKMEQKILLHFNDKQGNEVENKKRITELRNNIDMLEERFVLKEITSDQFEKFKKKYSVEIDRLVLEMEQFGKISSNLKISINKSLDLAENLQQLWVTAEFNEKKKLQYMIFPDGMVYDKKNKAVLTPRVNTLFGEIAVLTSVSKENKKDNLLQDCLFGSHVGMTRFELATPRPPDVCATGLRYIPKK